MAQLLTPTGAVVQPMDMRRRPRRPQHSFHLRHKPFQIQPFMIAPVIPGETMTNLLLQSRVVTDPIRNPLIGWWCEYYLFYVKHRDMSGRDDFTAMMLDPSHDMSGYNATAKRSHNHYGGAIDWVEHCLERCVDEYFRNEGETWNGYLIGDLPAASVSQQNWLDSAVNAADMVTADSTLDVGVDDQITGSEIEQTLMHWQFLRANNMTDMSYEDFLRQYGVRGTEAEDPHRPELIRYLREWSYPTNTVDPTDGAPSSAVSWAIAERADKNRFFSEPGFIFGVTVVRPKVYFSNIAGNAASAMQDAYSWLPAMLTNDANVSWKQFAQGAGPLPSITDVDGYWVDLRDLLLYGDQFVNFALTETDAGMVALPTAGMQKRYPTEAMVDDFFVDETIDGNQLVRQDGVVSLSILTRQRDTSHAT